MTEKTTVAFRIAQSVRDEWDTAVDENPEYQSLSHLIRLSVQRELNDVDREVEPSTDNSQDASNGEILESLTRVERVVDSIQDEVKATGREQRSEGLYDLQQVLLELLPTDDRPPSEVRPSREDEEQRFKQGATTAEDLAARIGAKTSDVGTALERLADDTGMVQTHTIDGTPYYWRKV